MIVLHRFFNKLWYGSHPVAWLFWPVSRLFLFLARHRRAQYLVGKKPAYHPQIPVIVVGNISVGGTGKTPISIWLIEELKKRGLRPGLVSRGYGGKAPDYPYSVSASDSASVTGDEPLMIHLRTGIPVVVDPDRAGAVRYLIENEQVDVVISDDGLQHYRLARTMELVVVDGERGFGNEKTLPMGPLREPIARLEAVDAILVNGAVSHPTLSHLSHLHDKIFSFTLQTGAWVPLNSESIPEIQSLESGQQKVIHGLAGIGNPQRFFATLGRLGIPHQPHSFPDHHDYTELDLEPFEAGLVLTTEKDAVKLRHFGSLRGAYLPINVEIMNPEPDQPGDGQLQPSLIDVIMVRLEAFSQHHRHLY